MFFLAKTNIYVTRWAYSNINDLQVFHRIDMRRRENWLTFARNTERTLRIVFNCSLKTLVQAVKASHSKVSVM